MDIRITINFQFEDKTYPADILILNLSSTIENFFYVVHIFDEFLLNLFPSRYIFIARDKKFLPVKTKTKREGMLIQAIQKAIVRHRNNPFYIDEATSHINKQEGLYEDN